MTSTSFNVGLGDGSRSSSRVLRPPGGGHTDIFAGAEPLQVRKDNGRNASSILEGTNSNAVPPSPVKAPAPPQPPTTNNEPAAAPARGRVPPGGFSSGLW
ncbi:jupiter microtubule associated homolog 1 [Anoplophora glabripennis]|uniref:jupiter microtubule associated homolog 1 n=1 Tax=Anoplophora glabripennis TaxID=217634 RepID=UPI000875087A|nr:jupiter microtubule associated homolog 1 [Anoplophora glabripennis]XP_018567233.1 jupiter microtubule associated homolog 1 [Anoplophora glabripennis]